MTGPRRLDPDDLAPADLLGSLHLDALCGQEVEGEAFYPHAGRGLRWVGRLESWDGHDAVLYLFDGSRVTVGVESVQEVS